MATDKKVFFEKATILAPLLSRTPEQHMLRSHTCDVNSDTKYNK